MCAPAIPVDDYFARRPSTDRDVFEAVMSHFAEVGPVTVEAVSVGILFKRKRTFVELRPRNRGGLRLSFVLSRRLEHPRIAQTKAMSRTSHRRAYGVNVARREDVDELVRVWLTEAYFDSGE
ncbi:MAG: hypothetical protein C0506_05485 [Anaerolinea sp.]|nr:hypothetical protein [Anaerolinea sp.]